MDPNPLAPTFLEMLIPFGLPLALVCVLLYSIIRFAVWPPRGGPQLHQVRKHAYWTGLIAWMFSSLAAAGQSGTYHYGQASQPGSPWASIPWFALLGPVAAVIAIHALGQATWPAPKSAKRVATLEFRRVRDYVPPALGWTVLGSFLLTASVIPFVAATRGFQAVSAPPPGTLSAWTMGKVDGWVLAVALTLPLLLLAAGTLLVMRLIASRRSLESLTPEQNKTLRIIGMNRLLRLSATVASGYSAIAGNYLSQPRPGSDTMSYTNWLGLVNMAVLATMFFWKPPTLELATSFPDAEHARPFRPSKESYSAARLMDSTAVVLVPSAAAGALLGYAVRDWLGWMGSISLPMIFMVFSYLALEMVLVRNYGSRAGSHSGDRPPLEAPLPAWLHVGFGLSALALSAAIVYAVTSSTSVPPRRWDGFPAPWAICVVPCILAVAILLAGLTAGWVVRSRPALVNVPAIFDATLRRRSLFRIARTVTSCWFALAGLVLTMAEPPATSHPHTLQVDLSVVAALCFALGAIALFLPVRAYSPADVSPEGSDKPSMSK